MNGTIKAAAALSVTGLLALTGCSGSSSAESGSTLNVVGYSVLEQANSEVIKAFGQTDAGAGVTIKGSYGASGDQSRAVAAGQDADEVHLSLEPDVTRLVDEGIVAKGWKDNATKGICTDSVVVMVVKKGNPKDLHTWTDLVKPGVGIVTPNPASSGSAKWNLLAAYGSARASGGGDAAAAAYMEKFFANVAALPDSGRDATTAFTNGTGDVLLSYENEAILARQSGQDFDYVVPDTTLLIENPCAVTQGAGQDAEAFLDFQKSPAGQQLYARTGYRPLSGVKGLGDLRVEGANDPSNPFPQPKRLLTVDQDFGGWDAANATFFDEKDGVLTQIQARAGQ